MRTKLGCHNCGGVFNVDFDETLNGNHIVKCPKCEHEHCRVIKNGEVTDDRWDSRNGGTFYVTGYGYSTASTTTSNYSPTASSVTYFAWSDITSYTSASY